MIGRNRGSVTTQGEFLSDLFSDAGYQVLSVSAAPNRYRRLWEIVRTIVRHRRDIDVQCLQVYGGPSFVVEDIASVLGRRFGHRIVMHVHGGAMPEFMSRHPVWTRRVLSRADAFVAPSPFLARAIKPYGFHAGVIPNLIQLADYPYRHRTNILPKLFWMRTFEPLYNPELALRTLARVRRVLPEATLVMAGQEKGHGPEVRRLAEDLGVACAVRFAGFLDGARKAREGDAADLFLNTNRVDNMPVSVVEACAMGLPVVATAVGGVPDLLTHEETGLLVPDDDDEAMAAAVHRLLQEPALTGRISASARELAERCAWDKVRPMWESVWARVMDAPAKSG